MTLAVTVWSPLLSGGRMELYRTGATGSARLLEGLSPIVRKTDVFTGSQTVASSGTWRMEVHDPDGVFGPDGIFTRWDAATVSVEIQGEAVFIGRPETVESVGSHAGLTSRIVWRDLVDDLLACQVRGIRSQSREGLIVVAQAQLNEFTAGFGITLPSPPNLTLWYPERTQTLRKWIVPVLSALGYSLDWDASGGIAAARIVGAHESRFRNSASLPIFRDAHLEGSRAPTWTSGREQVINLWSGRHRFYNEEALRFDTRDVNGYGDLRVSSVAAGSRARYGERAARISLEAVSGLEGVIVRIADEMVNRRAWPHPRATFRLIGRSAAALRIGDGLVTAMALATSRGIGLRHVWRVQGRSVDLEKESATLYCERRDDRDEDYRHWSGAGGTTHEGSA